jgi:putative FmdB family regulatory protein
MPIYEYTCRKCGHGFEHLARRLSEPAPRCPKCGAAGPTKGFSSFSAGRAQSRTPCEGGSCPSMGPGAPSCAGGKCPF